MHSFYDFDFSNPLVYEQRTSYTNTAKDESVVLRRSVPAKCNKELLFKFGTVS